MEIQQSSCFLMSLMRDVASGHTIPAAMQRPYVWRPQDVEALCDSIISGFPIGSFLIWAPGSEADISRLAKPRLGPPINGTSPTPKHRYLLLDGQNRLATLAWMSTQEPITDLSDASEAERDTWMGPRRLVLDGMTRSVIFVPSSDADLGLRLPAWTLVASITERAYGDAMHLVRDRWRNRWANQFEESEIEAFLKFWGDCCGRFTQARSTETVIQDATVDEARHAFMRICRVGVPISQEDFDRALAWEPPASAFKFD